MSDKVGSFIYLFIFFTSTPHMKCLKNCYHILFWGFVHFHCWIADHKPMILLIKKITLAILRSSVDIGWFFLYHPKHATCRLTHVTFLPDCLLWTFYVVTWFLCNNSLSVLIEYFSLKRNLKYCFFNCCFGCLLRVDVSRGYQYRFSI